MSALQAQEADSNELKISEARTSAILRFMTDGVIQFDEQGVMLFVNEAVSSIFGYSADEMTGKPLNLLIPEAETQTHNAYLRQYEQSREARSSGDRVEVEAWHKTGRIFPIEIIINEMVDDSGSSFIGVIRDISERKQAEAALKINDLALKSISQGVVITGLNENIISVNEAFLEITGYARPEVLGKNCRFLRGSATDQESVSAIRHAITGRSRFDKTILNYRKDGTPFWNELTITPLLNELNQVSHFIGVLRDVTKQQADRQALRESVTYSQTLFNSVDEGIHGIDLDGKIIFENQVAIAMFGWEEQEMLGQCSHALIHHTRADGSPYPQHECHIFASLQGKSTARIEDEVFWRKDGTSFPVSYHATAMLNDAGDIIGSIVSFRNISGRLKTEQRLNKAKTMAEQANRAKSIFLANMSHEIRTPINAVLGFSDLALRLDPPEIFRDYLEKIHCAASIQLGVINDILNFSKIEANKLKLEAIPFNLNEVLQDSYDLFKLNARAKGIELVVGAKPEVPELLSGDALRLSQVINNLLGNAIKFTASGEVSLIVTVELICDDSVRLIFKIQDSGIGMSEAEQSGLFQAFSQADSSTTRTHGGTGLGLVISRQLVELMGGELTLQSQSGTGSCFTFSACFTQQQKAQLTPAHLNTRTLLIEDSAVMRLLMSKQLTNFGCQVESVATGTAALTMLQQGAQFELILLDYNLPDINGCEIARQIRKAGHKMPIIVITGSDIEQLRIQAGDTIQDFLAKPVSLSTLYDSINRVLGGYAVVPPVIDPRSVRAAPPPLTGYHILLVDDNAFNREVGSELISLTGASVDTAVDGLQAVQAVLAKHYDLVLMDIQMPVMDGYEAARRILRHKPDLPIVALTAHAMTEEKARVLACGMNDILTKPLMPGELFTLLVRYLTGAEQAELSASRETPAELLPELPTDLPADFLPAGGFDYATALSRVNGDPVLLLRFLRIFHERNATVLQDIEAALSNLPVARRLLHNLKGGAGTIGMIALQAAALNLELKLSGSSAQLNVGSGFKRLKAEFDKTQGVLAQILKQAK